MPATAVITLIGTTLLVAALAGYLIRVALTLRDVVVTLDTVLGAVVATADEAAPIGQVATAINADLDASAKVLAQACAQVQQVQHAKQGNGSQPSTGVGAPGR